MGFDRILFISFLLMSLIASASSSSFISERVFDIHEDSTSAGRKILQAKKGCQVNFEFLNYTIITSECKGPHYPADRCCSAFKDFACPYADVLNDLTNDCASTMFSYINLYGRYPPGLFASECREGKLGLACPADSPSASLNDDNKAHSILVRSSSITLIIPACILFLFSLF